MWAGLLEQKAPPSVYVKGGHTMLDFRMNTFLTVCRCMNYTRASEELHITQPAVSQHIRYLEQYYGQKLFQYEGKQLGLTEAGEMLRNASLTMLHDELSLQNRMQGSSEKRLEFRCGITSALGTMGGADVLQYALEDTESSFLRLKTANTAELLQSLENDEIEFALIDGMIQASAYASCPFIKGRLAAVCAPEFSKKYCFKEFQDLLQTTVLFGAAGESVRETLVHFLSVQNLSIEDFAKVIEISSRQGLKELTKAGCGITFLYEPAISEELKSGELKEIRLKDFHVTHDFTFVWKKENPSAERYQKWFEQCRERWAKM